MLSDCSRMNAFMILIRQDVHFSGRFLHHLALFLLIVVYLVLRFNSLNESLEGIILVNVEIMMLFCHGLLRLRGWVVGL